MCGEYMCVRLQNSPDIRFLDTQKGRAVNDVEVRYKQDPAQRYNYSKELGKNFPSSY